MRSTGKLAGNGRARGSGRKARRTWLLLGTAAVLIVLGAVLVGPPRGPGTSPLASRAPEGFLALARFLHEMGLDIREGEVPPDPSGTFILLQDVRDETQAASLIQWTSRGGRLVVADPESIITELLGISDTGPIGGIIGTTTLRPGCIGPEAVGIARIEARVSDSALRAGGPAGTSCFPGARGALVVHVPQGSGEVVLLGGSSALTNELLDQADNAPFALAILGTPRAVTFGPPLPPAGIESSRSLWSLLPDRAKVVLLGLALVAVAFAFVRGRRLGKPGSELPVSPLPASELVRATGRLYRAARATAHCGRLLREGLAAWQARRMGLPPTAPAGELAGGLGEGEDRRRLEQLLTGPDPRNDDELIALGRDLERLRARMEGARR